MWGGTDEEASIKTILTALDKGINFIDTAPVYGFGRSEEIVGKALKQYGQRDKIILATKAGLNWDKDGNVFRDSTRTRITAEVDDSLRRLQRETLDLYQIHWPDTVTSFSETGDVLAGLMSSGKIRAVGVSNFSPAQIDELAKHVPITSVQPPYNLFERAIDHDVLPYAQEKKISVLAYSSICRGLLSGRITADTTYEGDDLRRIDPKFTVPRVSQYLAAVEQFKTLAKNHYGKSVMALAMRWVLDRGAIALWGARTPNQLDPIDDMMGWSISPEHMTAIDAILSDAIDEPIGPDYLAPPLRSLV
jgi:aryl-alcohol dehydrogenase-like predicted oxidoreductase